MIDIQNVNKSFKGSPAIQDLTLQVKEGEILGLLGVDIPVKLGSSSLLVKRMLNIYTFKINPFFF
jgi:ABC-type uncharacterized transport system ATPase subunit